MDILYTLPPNIQVTKINIIGIFKENLDLSAIFNELTQMKSNHFKKIRYSQWGIGNGILHVLLHRRPYKFIDIDDKIKIQLYKKSFMVSGIKGNFWDEWNNFLKRSNITLPMIDYVKPVCINSQIDVLVDDIRLRGMDFKALSHSNLWGKIHMYCDYDKNKKLRKYSSPYALRDPYSINGTTVQLTKVYGGIYFNICILDAKKESALIRTYNILAHTWNFFDPYDKEDEYDDEDEEFFVII